MTKVDINDCCYSTRIFQNESTVSWLIKHVCSLSHPLPQTFYPHSGLSPLVLHSYSSCIFLFHNHTLTSCSSLKYLTAHTLPLLLLLCQALVELVLPPVTVAKEYYHNWAMQQMGQRQGNTNKSVVVFWQRQKERGRWNNSVWYATCASV